MAKDGVTVRDKGLQRLLSMFLRPQTGYCSVGVHEKAPKREAPKTAAGSSSKKSAMSNADIARVHEFGAPTKGIPQRSFVRSTAKKHHDRYKRLLRTGAKAVALGRMTHRQMIEIVALRMSQDMVDTIDDGLSPGLKADTIKRKGSSKPLIDTGQLKRSITWVYHPQKLPRGSRR